MLVLHSQRGAHIKLSNNIESSLTREGETIVSMTFCIIPPPKRSTEIIVPAYCSLLIGMYGSNCHVLYPMD